MVVETHIELLHAADGRAVTIHLDHERENFNLVVTHEHLDRNLVDHIPFLVLEMEHLRDLGKRLAVQQHHVLTVNAARRIDRRHQEVHRRVERSGGSQLAIDHSFERTQHRQHRIDRR